MTTFETVKDILTARFSKEPENLLITNGIADAVAKFIIANSYNSPSLEEVISGPNIINFIKNNQPFLESIDENVQLDIENYFKGSSSLSKYKVVGIFRASNHPEDKEMYSVIAKKDDIYACWSSWNERTKSMNFGHYNIASFDDAYHILEENFNDITKEPAKYGMGNTAKLLMEQNEIIAVINNFKR